MDKLKLLQIKANVKRITNMVAYVKIYIDDLSKSYNLRKRMHVEYWLRNFERIYCWRLRLCMPNIAGRAKERHFHSGHKTILYSFLLCDS